MALVALMRIFQSLPPVTVLFHAPAGPPIRIDCGANVRANEHLPRRHRPLPAPTAPGPGRNGRGLSGCRSPWGRGRGQVAGGDNYVASAEPELRERMGELYSNIATNYDRVDGSLKSNFELISEEFTTEKTRFAKIMDKQVKKFYKTLNGNDISLPVIKAKEVFLAKD